MGDVIDFSSYLRFVIALVFVLGLILGAAHIARKFMTGRIHAGSRSQGRRLGVVEALALDARHRVFLIRRDGKEHLIMTGPSGDLLIEGGIEEAAGHGTGQAIQHSDARVTPLHAENNVKPDTGRVAGTSPGQDTLSALQRMAGLFGERRA